MPDRPLRSVSCRVAGVSSMVSDSGSAGLSAASSAGCSSADSSSLTRAMICSTDSCTVRVRSEMRFSLFLGKFLFLRRFFRVGLSGRRFCGFFRSSCRRTFLRHPAPVPPSDGSSGVIISRFRRRFRRFARLGFLRRCRFFRCFRRSIRFPGSLCRRRLFFGRRHVLRGGLPGRFRLLCFSGGRGLPAAALPR